jgi:hypothetical protein
MTAVPQGPWPLAPGPYLFHSLSAIWEARSGVLQPPCRSA